MNSLGTPHLVASDLCTTVVTITAT